MEKKPWHWILKLHHPSSLRYPYTCVKYKPFLIWNINFYFPNNHVLHWDYILRHLPQVWMLQDLPFLFLLCQDMLQSVYTFKNIYYAYYGFKIWVTISIIYVPKKLVFEKHITHFRCKYIWAYKTNADLFGCNLTKIGRNVTIELHILELIQWRLWG